MQAVLISCRCLVTQLLALTRRVRAGSDVLYAVLMCIHVAKSDEQADVSDLGSLQSWGYEDRLY